MNSSELAACVGKFTGTYERCVLVESDLVRETSECEGEFLRLLYCWARELRVVWVRADSEDVEFMREVGVFLFKCGGVITLCLIIVGLLADGWWWRHDSHWQ